MGAHAHEVAGEGSEDEGGSQPADFECDAESTGGGHAAPLGDVAAAVPPEEDVAAVAPAEVEEKNANAIEAALKVLEEGSDCGRVRRILQEELRVARSVVHRRATPLGHNVVAPGGAQRAEGNRR